MVLFFLFCIGHKENEENKLGVLQNILAEAKTQNKNPPTQMQTTSGLRLSDTMLANPPKCTPITAGIICFSQAPVTNTIFLLLGLETKQRLWCDFGGRINPGESVEGAAAREFCEESLCIIDMSPERVAFSEYLGHAKQMLLKRDYFLKLNIVHNTVDDVDQSRVYYLKHVPWQPDIKQKFARLHANLMTQNISCSHPAILETSPSYILDEHWLEKTKIKWWSLDRLKDVLKNRGKYKKHRFRQSFLRVLNLVLDKLEECQFEQNADVVEAM